MKPDELTISTGDDAELDEANAGGDIATPGSPAADFANDTGFDAFAGGTTERKFAGGTLLIIAVVVVAVLGVVSMRKLAQVTAAATVDTDIEGRIEDFLRKLAGMGPAGPDSPGGTIDEGEEILARISEAYTERQVPLQDVQRNPFILFRLEVAPVETPDNTRDEAAEAAEAERRWQEERANRQVELETAGETFVLKTIMDGAEAMAIVNGQIVRVGDTIFSATNEQFRVSTITSGSVDLIAEAPEYDLEVTVTVFLQRSR